jgi:hypothetical protein
LISDNDTTAKIHSFGSAFLMGGENEKWRRPTWSRGEGISGADIRLSVTLAPSSVRDALDWRLTS